MWRDYLELTKPRLSSLVLVTAAVGFWLGMRPGDSLAPLAPALLGLMLVVGGANALNEWSERELDALMQRTKHRPLPAGRLTPAQAQRFGVGCLMAGLAVLTLFVNALSAGLAAFSAASYLFLYTPLKRRTPLCTLIGAIPGALPPMIGWAAARGALGSGAWALFAILFIWQLPHFLALAALYQEDYARAGFKMLPIIAPDGSATARQLVLYGAALLPASLFPSVTGLTGPASFYGALLLGALFLVIVVGAARRRSLPSARRLFFASILYLPALLALLAWDRVSVASAGTVVRPLGNAPAAAALNYGRVPAFTLIDQRGKSVTRDELRGKVWIADFIFTRCAGQCPMMNREMMTLAQRFRSAPDFCLVSFTVDPAHDTPEVLAGYAQRLEVEGEQWRFVTGSPEAIRELAQGGFHLSTVEGGSEQEPITHSVRLVLVDREGVIRRYYPADDPQAVEQVARDAAALLSTGAPPP